MSQPSQQPTSRCPCHDEPRLPSPAVATRWTLPIIPYPLSPLCFRQSRPEHHARRSPCQPFVPLPLAHMRVDARHIANPCHTACPSSCHDKVTSSPWPAPLARPTTTIPRPLTGHRSKLEAPTTPALPPNPRTLAGNSRSPYTCPLCLPHSPPPSMGELRV